MRRFQKRAAPSPPPQPPPPAQKLYRASEVYPDDVRFEISRNGVVLKRRAICPKNDAANPVSQRQTARNSTSEHSESLNQEKQFFQEQMEDIAAFEDQIIRGEPMCVDQFSYE